VDAPSHYEADFATSIGIFGASVIYFDLDHFKQLNTRFTEPIVDRSILIPLNEMVRDVTIGRGFAYAEGGDEFLILLPNTPGELAVPFVELLLATLRRQQFTVGHDHVSVTASAGLAMSMVAVESQLCRDRAALAKQKAKDAGRDRYESFSERHAD